MRGWKTLGSLALALATTGAQAALPLASEQWREGEIIVKYRHGPAARMPPAGAELGLVHRRTMLGGRAALMALPAYLRVRDALSLLHGRPGIEYVEPNMLRHASVTTPDDPLFPFQWGLRNTGQAYESSEPVPSGDAATPAADLNLAAAWDQDDDGMPDSTGDGSVVVAVVDDGFELTHPDLSANFVTGFDFIDGGPPSGGEHGTLVAGSLGAIGNNGIGVAGTAWNVKLMPLRFDFSIADFISAIEYARDHGARIINCSFGGPAHSQAEYDAIADLRDAGILLIAAAGNSDSNTDVAVASYPANHDLPNIISVAASNRGDNIAGFSQFGPTTADLAAPGVEIRTTAVGGTYQSVSGTSFSTPLVAGVAALIAMRYPAADFREIRARLIEGGVAGAGPLPDASARRTRGGRLDADRALSLAPQPSLVLRSWYIDDPNGRLDPGETSTLDVVVENLWTDARNVSAQLDLDDSACSSAIEFPSATQLLADLAQGGTATARFAVTPGADMVGHCFIPATVRLTAEGGYDRVRHLILEFGRLEEGAVVETPFQTDAFDEFHAWHIDVPYVPSGASGLRIFASAGSDIDLLVKHGAPPQYNVQLSVSPEPGEQQLFFTDADFVGGSGGGVEAVTIESPQPGTYHIVALNFSQAAQPYTLRADFVWPTVFALDQSDIAVPESANGVAIAVRRTRSSVGFASVDVVPTAGTAEGNCDFSSAPIHLWWEDGDDAVKYAVFIIGVDGAGEDTETFSVSLANPQSGTAATIGTPATAVVSIIDDDAGDPADQSKFDFAFADYQRGTEGQEVQVGVSRTCGGPTPGPASVEYRTRSSFAVEGEDYEPVSGTLQWAEGDMSTKYFRVKLIDDGVTEPCCEWFGVELSNPSGGSIVTTSAAVNIDDAPAHAGGSGGGGGPMAPAVLLGLLGGALLRLRHRSGCILGSCR